MLKKHPNYDKDVQQYIQKDPHKALRSILILKISSQKTGLTLIMDHTLGGGANIYTNALIEKYKQEEKNILLVKYDFENFLFTCIHTYKKYTFRFYISSFEKLQILFSQLHVKELFLNNLVSFKESHLLLEYLSIYVKENSIALTIPIHDFYAICPSYTLLNDKEKYCNIPDLDSCNTCMLNNNLEWKNLYSDNIDIAKWRELWFLLLNQSTSILCFSNSSKNILLKAYPNLNKNKIQVTPHSVPMLPSITMEKNIHTKIKTIGVLGAINHAKGSKIIKDIIQIIEDNNLNINIVLIGEISEPIKSKHFKTTGKYQRNELPQLIKQHHIDMFLIPSIWPETFSYTTQEIIMMDMPLMVFDIGAPAERIKNYDKGYIINQINAQSVLNIINKNAS